jgi:hypothetical protein
VNPTEYRFTVPNGTYRVELRFAELKQIKSGARIFNVTIEGATVLANLDIVAKTGASFRADVEVFTVSVADGTLNIGFVPRAGLQPPLVNGLFVQQQ